MFDVTKFNERKNWTIEDLADRLFSKGGKSRVGMWSSGSSNPRYAQILKLIELGATASELFGDYHGELLLKNSDSGEKPRNIEITNEDLSAALVKAARMLVEKDKGNSGK